MRVTSQGLDPKEAHCILGVVWPRIMRMKGPPMLFSMFFGMMRSSMRSSRSSVLGVMLVSLFLIASTFCSPSAAQVAPELVIPPAAPIKERQQAVELTPVVPQQVPAPSKVSREKVLIVDFHGVLFHLDSSWNGFTEALWGVLPTLKNCCKLLASGQMSKVKFKEAATPVNPQVPQREVIAALQEAKAHGCHIILLSNIAPREFAKRIARYPELRLTELFEYEVRPGKMTDKHGQWLDKGSLPIYQHCADHIAQRYPGAQVIFFDDNEKNLERGKKVGFQPRLVISSEQMVRDVRALIAAKSIH